MENQLVQHVYLNQKYRLVLERTATAKGVDGFKVEANGDDMDSVVKEANTLYSKAIEITTPKPAVTEATAATKEGAADGKN